MKITVSYINSLYDSKKTVDLINETSADAIHVDLIDGIYAGTKNFDINHLPEIFKDNRKPIDIHMMVNRPSGYLNDLLKDYKGYEVVVLGCTHFPLAKNAITKGLGNVTFVDGSHGIKNRVYDLIKDKLNKKGGKINIISTKDDVSKIILDIVKGNK